MILHRLTMRGISDVFPDEVSIDFDALGEGIICFVGDNLSGKSHLLELSGIGTTHRWLPYYDEPVASHVEDDTVSAFTDLAFSLGDHRYRCKVQIDPQANGDRKTEAWLWRDGAEKPIAGEKVTAVDREMAKLMPGRKDILATNFACQSREMSLFTIPKAEKKALFMRQLRLERLQAMSKLAGERAKTAADALEPLRREMAAAQQRIERAQVLEGQIIEAREAFAQLEQQRSALRAARDTIVARLAGARETFAAAEATAAAAQQRRDALVAEIITVTSELDAATRRVATLEAALADAPAVREAAERVAKLDRRAGELSGETDRLRAAIAPLDTEAAELGARLEGLLTEHRRLIAEKSAGDAAAARVAAAGDVDGDAQAARAAHEGAAAAVAARQEALPGLEAAAEAEQAAATSRAALLARRGDLEPRTGLLASIDVTHPMCAVCPLTADARQVSTTIAGIDEQLEALPPAQDAAATLRTARTDLAAAQRRLTAAAQALAEAEAIVLELRADREAAGRAGAIDEAIDANVVAGKAARARQQEIAQQRTGLQAELDAAVTYRSAIDDERAPITAQAARLADVTTAEARIDEAHAARTKLLGRLDALRSEQAAITIPDLSAERAAVAEDTASSTKHDTDLNVLEREIMPANDSLQRAIGEQLGLQEAAGQLEGLRGKAAGLERDAADWSHLERAFGPNGIQSLEISAAGPAVTAIANDLLSSCFRGRWQVRIETTEPGKKKGVVKEIFDVVIIDGKTGRTRKKTSGGGMVIIDFAMRLALSIYNGQRAGSPLRTLWLDEADGALSTANATRYIRMLRRARELGGYHQILMITHSPAVWAQADARLYVGGGRVSTTPLEDAQEAA